jgi:DNA-binding HxlR family transcriptional regulator
MSSRTELHTQTARAGYPRVGERDVLLAVSDLFGRKWHGLVLYQLHTGSMSFTELKHDIDGISGKMLAESLEVLTETYGVIERHEPRDSPNRVEYSLSPAGEALTPLLLGLYDWGSEHLEPETHE